MLIDNVSSTMTFNTSFCLQNINHFLLIHVLNYIKYFVCYLKKIKIQMNHQNMFERKTSMGRREWQTLQTKILQKR